jgi:tRNA pseudouridine38-40 synthase
MSFEMEPVNQRLRYAVMTEYDGSAFNGWQRQRDVPSVQQCLEEAWHQLTGERIRLSGGSRTDAGVSALRHVSSFISGTRIPPDRIALAWNTVLPAQVAALAVRQVHQQFNPRYDALGKTYRYHLRTGSTRPVISRRHSTFIPGRLDLEAMRQAAGSLRGKHDFTAFMDQGSPTKRPVRTLHEINIQESEDQVTLTFTGDGFLYHMVRVLTGTLVAAGQGKIDPATMGEIINSGDRARSGPTLPPQGLLLERVFFADQLFGDDRWPYEDPRREGKIAHLLP